MQADLHYYVTYIAARAAGWCHEDASEIALAAHYVDCSGDPDSLSSPWTEGATLQGTITCVEQLWKAKENTRTMPPDNQVIWSAFHFLPAFDTKPEARYDYAYDDRKWPDMRGNGIRRRVPHQHVSTGWLYTPAVKSKGIFANEREWKLAMRCFPNSRTIDAMTADTITQLDTLNGLRAGHLALVNAPANDGQRYSEAVKARAERDKALALIGVRLHVLADTFSHAGFAGTTSSINKEDGSWLLTDPTKPNQHETEINFALGSHGVAKWMAVGHAMAGALPDMPGARYCFRSPKLDVRIYKDNPLTYRYAIIAVRQFLVDTLAHVAPRQRILEEPGALRMGVRSREELEEPGKFQALFETLVGPEGQPIFLTDEDFQFPHRSDRVTGYALRHITSWAWGSNMWEYNGDKADNSLELRSRNLLARIRRIMPAPAPAAAAWHDLCTMVKIGDAGEYNFHRSEEAAGLGATYISNKNTEYSVVRRVRLKYWQQRDTVPQLPCLRAADWAAHHHHTWFNTNYGPAIRREIQRDRPE